jgi:hypothetical protein
VVCLYYSRLEGSGEHTPFWRLLAIVLVGSSASARHGCSAFDHRRDYRVEGDLEWLLYASPHVVMKIGGFHGLHGDLAARCG